MTISEHTGDMFTSKHKVFGHGVNCERNMNSGLAYHIQHAYPEVFEEYLTKDFTGGDIQPVRTHDGKVIINIASQIKSGRNAEMKHLLNGVRNALEWVENSAEYNALVLPQIGCGVGGLEWDDVRLELIKLSREYPTVELELWSYPEAS